MAIVAASSLRLPEGFANTRLECVRQTQDAHNNQAEIGIFRSRDILKRLLRNSNPSFFRVEKTTEDPYAGCSVCRDSALPVMASQSQRMGTISTLRQVSDWSL